MARKNYLRMPTYHVATGGASKARYLGLESGEPKKIMVVVWSCLSCDGIFLCAINDVVVWGGGNSCGPERGSVSFLIICSNYISVSIFFFLLFMRREVNLKAEPIICSYSMYLYTLYILVVFSK